MSANKSLLAAAILLALFVMTAVPAGADAAQKKRSVQQAEPAPPSITRHSIRIGGKSLAYTATAGMVPLKNDAGETEATIFYVGYHADVPPSAPPRPLMFIFNGGPGAGSVWLHLGAIGPRRVQMLPDGNMPPPPFKVLDNEYSWLDKGDLVFIDPVGTGFSRAAKPDLTKNFTAVRADIEYLGRFIRLYLTRSQRWSSPLFLVGESYGSFRCAGISEYLLEHGIALNGMILISSILNMQTVSFDNGNDLPYQLFLPSYTATAWYHGKLAPELQENLERSVAAAEEWASTEYLWALNRGDRLAPDERKRIVEKLARFTGLSPFYVDNLNLRIDSRSFVRELLRDRRQRVGYMDSRLSAANVEPSAPSGFDPTIATIRPPFTAAINAYVREELGFQSDLEYFTLGGGIGQWDWETKNGYADTSDNLRNSLAKNPYMKVFVASGYFDLATPHFATDYTMAHLGLTPALRKNISIRRYRSGHMMYIETTEALQELKRDVADFFAASLRSVKVETRSN